MSKALFVISSSGFSNFSCPRKAKVWRYSYLQTAAFMSSGISSVLLLIVLSDCLQSSSDTHHTIQPSSCCLWFRSRAIVGKVSLKGFFLSKFLFPCFLAPCLLWLTPPKKWRTRTEGCWILRSSWSHETGSCRSSFFKTEVFCFFLLYTTIKLENK